MATERLELVIATKGGRTVERQLTGIGDQAQRAGARTQKMGDSIDRGASRGARSLRRTQNELRRTGNEAARTGGRITSMMAAFTVPTAAAASLRNMQRGLRGLAGAVSGFYAGRYLAQAFDDFTRIQNTLKGFGVGAGSIDRVTDALTDLANEARVSSVETATLFGRLRLATRDLGLSEKEVLDLTGTLNKALRLSGSSGLEASQSVRQLSQAFNKGKLDGDEFRSVLENAPILTKLLTKELKISKGELYDWAAAGKITTKILSKAIKEGSADIDAAFKNLRPTIGDAFTNLFNNIRRFVGTTPEVGSAVSTLTDAITFLGENLNVVLGILEAYAGIFVAGKVIALFSGMTKGAKALSAALKGLAASQALVGGASVLEGAGAAAGAGAAGLPAGVISQKILSTPPPIDGRALGGGAGIISIKKTVAESKKVESIWKRIGGGFKSVGLVVGKFILSPFKLLFRVIMLLVGGPVRLLVVALGGLALGKGLLSGLKKANGSTSEWAAATETLGLAWQETTRRMSDAGTATAKWFSGLAGDLSFLFDSLVAGIRASGVYIKTVFFDTGVFLDQMWAKAGSGTSQFFSFIGEGWDKVWDDLGSAFDRMVLYVINRARALASALRLLFTQILVQLKGVIDKALLLKNVPGLGNLVDFPKLEKLSKGLGALKTAGVMDINPFVKYFTDVEELDENLEKSTERVESYREMWARIGKKKDTDWGVLSAESLLKIVGMDTASEAFSKEFHSVMDELEKEGGALKLVASSLFAAGDYIASEIDDAVAPTKAINAYAEAFGKVKAEAGKVQDIVKETKDLLTGEDSVVVGKLSTDIEKLLSMYDPEKLKLRTQVLGPSELQEINNAQNSLGEIGAFFAEAAKSLQGFEASVREAGGEGAALDAAVKKLDADFTKAAQKLPPAAEEAALLAAEKMVTQVNSVMSQGAVTIRTTIIEAFGGQFGPLLSGLVNQATNSLGTSNTGVPTTKPFEIVDPATLATIETLKGKVKEVTGLYREQQSQVAALQAQTAQSFRQTAASAGNTSSEIKNFFESSFSSLEDALVGFVTTGKLDFKSLINSIIADLARMVIRMLIIKPLMGFFGGLFGFSGGGVVPGFKNGGQVQAFAPGGIVSGFGGARSDNQLAALSPGEMVINAGSTKQNLGALEYINKTGKMPPSGGGGGSTVFAPSIVINQEGNDPEVTAQMVDAAVRRSWTELAVKSQRKGGVFDRRNG